MNFPTTVGEAYDRIIAYFGRPGARFAWDTEAGACQYLTVDGDKCAIGCLLSQERAYHYDAAGSPTPAVLHDHGVDSGSSLYRFLLEAQKLHDTLAEDALSDPAEMDEGWVEPTVTDFTDSLAEARRRYR